MNLWHTVPQGAMSILVDDNGTLHWLDTDGREHVELAATQFLSLTVELNQEGN